MKRRSASRMRPAKDTASPILRRQNLHGIHSDLLRKVVKEDCLTKYHLTQLVERPPEVLLRACLPARANPCRWSGIRAFSNDAYRKVSSRTFDRFSLKGHVALVTGAAGLIGAEICRVFSDAGATLALVDRRIDPAADQVRALKLAPATHASVHAADIADARSVESMVTAVEKAHGKVDVLVNCAAIDAKFDSSGGGATSASLHDMPLDLWTKSVDVNITGTFLVTKRVLQGMVMRRSGNIINIGSCYSLVSPDQKLYGDDPDAPGFRPKPVDYVATKSMIPNFTRYIAATYGTKGIRSNCLVPHGIETDHAADFKKRFALRSALGRMCRLEEIGPPALFLACDASSYMTGSTVVVDGGWTAW